MSRKDYVRLAETFRNNRPAQDGIALDMWRSLMQAIARTLAADNARFPWERFERACEE